MAPDKNTGEDPVIIKKYANRRLYNTQSSSYITQDDLSRMTREGVDFQVIDAKTGADITHQILTQIIMDEETNGEQMLPTSFLRTLISMYGNSMQSMMPHYLEAMMENFQTHQAKMQDSWKASVGPDAFKKMAETNMAMLQAATAAFMPGARQAGTSSTPSPEPQKDSRSELDLLKEQMAAMQKKLNDLGK